jgi:hypothetical protein
VILHSTALLGFLSGLVFQDRCSKLGPANHSLHRTPPRNVLVQATTSGCTLPSAPRRRIVAGGAGELKKRYAQAKEAPDS